MSDANATIWKIEGTDVWFYGRKGSYRYPSTIKGASPIPLDQLTVGHKYAITFKPFSVDEDLGRNPYFEKDCQEHALEPSQRSQPVPMPQQAPPGRGSGETGAYRGPDKDAEISATAVVKSCLEGGRELKEAMIAGLRWSAMWHELPPIPARYLAEHDAEFVRKLQAEFKAEGIETSAGGQSAETVEDLNDDIPF